MQTCFKGTKGIAKYLPKEGTFYLKFETKEISKISPKNVLSIEGYNFQRCRYFSIIFM